MLNRLKHADLIAIVMIGLLALGFGVLSYCAVLTKSATCDEPLHTVSGYANLYEHDFRVDPEDPPLFKYLAMIPHRAGSMKIDKTAPAWNQTIDYMWRQWEIVVPALYRTPGIDPETYVNRSRALMALLGMVLLATIAWWAWDLGGRTAAILAATLFCFDPNFLGHASLVKNDVAISLIFCAMAFVLYRIGQRLTRRRMLTLALLSAAALTTKFSGVMLVALFSLLLVVRALMGRPWLVFSRILVDRLNKLGAAISTVLICLAISYVAIWACYGFRYSATPDEGIKLNFQLVLRAGVRGQLMAANGDIEPSVEQVHAGMQSPAIFPQLILRANDHKLMPEAWLIGLLDTWSTTQRRPAFLMGQYSSTGWWYYFPMAMLFKTPLATMAVVVIAGWIAFRRRWLKRSPIFDRWTVICLAVPIAIYMTASTLSHLNLGLRHVLPVYPLIYVWAGAVIVTAWRSRSRRVVGVVMAILISGLAAETLAAYPNFIAFFNVAAGGSRGGYALLGDSNLDWGQDLTLLRAWQHEHPNTKLIVSLFSGADWDYFVNAQPLVPDSLHPATAPLTTTSAGDTVLAISASDLQGIYAPEIRRLSFTNLARHKPIAVLGGTIYLYRWPLQD